MMLMKAFGVIALIPTSMLMAVSFFVLFTIRKTDSSKLKVFGYVVAALLWVSALIIFSTGLYLTVNKPYAMRGRMHMPMMQQPMHNN